MNKLVGEQLNKVKKADLSNFNSETYTYIIPKKMEVKLKRSIVYLIHFKDSFFTNTEILNYWNKGSNPNFNYASAEVSEEKDTKFKLLCREYDFYTKNYKNNFWCGWVQDKDIEVITEVH